MATQALTSSGMGGVQGFAVGGPVGGAFGLAAGLISGIFAGKAATEMKRSARYYYAGAIEQRKAAEAQAGAVEAAAKLGIAQASADVINLGRFQRAALGDALTAESNKSGPEMLWVILAVVAAYLLTKG